MRPTRVFPIILAAGDSSHLGYPKPLALFNGRTALELAVGFVEQTLRNNGIAPAVQASIGVSDGERLWAVRYSSEGKSRTLFRSENVETIKHLHADDERIARLRDGDRLVVSEPFSDLPGDWHEIPEATALTVGPGGHWETRSFTPRVPAAS